MPDDQPTLWAGSCPECSGSGRVQIPLDFDWEETDQVACQVCGGSGIERPDAPP
jgi:DnaJ-class molecular chaperone